MLWFDGNLCADPAEKVAYYNHSDLKGNSPAAFPVRGESDLCLI